MSTLTHEIPATNEIITTDAKFPPGLEDLTLPDGYGVKGGAARAIAAWTLFDELLPVRDIDLVALPEADSQFANDLTKTHMPDDAATGKGVEVATTPEDFLFERDFTINEVVVIDGILYITSRGKEALEKKQIDPVTEDPGIKLKAKAQLMFAVFKDEGFDPTVNYKLNDIYDVHPFWCGLMLNRALEYGPEVAEIYIQRLNSCSHSEFADPIVFADPIDFANWMNDHDINASFPYIDRLLSGKEAANHHSASNARAVWLGQNAIKGYEHIVDWHNG